MVRKIKAHHNEELCLNLLLFFTYMYIYKNYIDCTARNIGVKDEELKIVLKL